MKNNRIMKDKQIKNNLDLQKKLRFLIIDIVGILIFMLLSTYIAIIALKMPKPRGWSSAPGLFPFILSITLFIMCLFLLIGTLKEKKQVNEKIGLINYKLMEYVKKSIKYNIRTIKAILFVAIYYFILVRIFPFEIATAIYLFVSLTQFWKKGKVISKIVISILAPLFFVIIFQEMFRLAMPGISLLELIMNFYRG